jgi:hypothetical protein
LRLRSVGWCLVAIARGDSSWYMRKRPYGSRRLRRRVPPQKEPVAAGSFFFAALPRFGCRRETIFPGSRGIRWLLTGVEVRLPEGYVGLVRAARALTRRDLWMNEVVPAVPVIVKARAARASSCRP